MGVAESTLGSQSQQKPSPSSDGITTISNRTEAADPLLEKIKALEITTPLFKSPPSEVALTDLLLRQVHFNEHGTLDPTTTASLLTLYHEWQRVAAEKVNKNQVDLSNKIEVVEALVIKLLQRFNSGLNRMKAGAKDLEDVHAMKQEVKQMKGRFEDVLERYNALVKDIEAEGPEFLKNDAKSVPFKQNCHFNETA